MSRFDGVIFDWAGTTIDYGCFAPVQAFVEIFRHFGVEPTMEEVRKPMGMLKIDHIRTMLGMERIKEQWKDLYQREPKETDVKAMFDLFEEKLLSVLDQFAQPKPGVVQTVEKLRSMGVFIGSTTGYTDKMMEIVIPAAREQGYTPDCWFSPDAVGQKGRPFPYMIFRNMEALGLSDVRRVLKVGDTISDIREGKNAGVFTVGVVVGSSEMGLTQEEYEALHEEERKRRCNETAKRFWEAGADEVIMDLRELMGWFSKV